MKKEKSPVLVVFCIFLLSLLVILPPVFRRILPKEVTNKEIEETTLPKLTVVNCNIIYPNELYQVRSYTKYVNNASPVNIMTFTKLDVLPENYVANEIVPTTSVIEELTYLKSIPNIQYSENQNIITFTLDNTVISSIPEDGKLSQYLNEDYDTQKTTFEALGYTCNLIES